MFGWFKRESEVPKISGALDMVERALKLVNNASYVLADTDDWKRMSESDRKISQELIEKFYIKAECQTRFLRDELLLTLRRLPGVKFVRRKVAK